MSKARRLAREQGMSFQELVRRYLRSLVGEPQPDRVAKELLELLRSRPGHSGGRPFRREDAYEGRVP